MKNKDTGIFIVLVALLIFACNPSKIELDTLAKQTVEIKTAIQSTKIPTPIPAKFLNPPEFLEEKFKVSSGWNWIEAVEGRRSAFQDSKNYQATFYLVHEKNMISVSETGSFSDVFVNFVLEIFVPVSTREKIIQFRNEHKEPGTYQAVIDGFTVELEIIEGKSNYIISVYETE